MQQSPPNSVQRILESGLTGISSLDEMFQNYLGGGGVSGFSGGATGSGWTPASEQFPGGGWLDNFPVPVPHGWPQPKPGTGSVLDSTSAAKPSARLSLWLWVIVGVVVLLLLLRR